MSHAEVHASSFRDPAGFVYRKGPRLLRQINKSYGEHYDHFMSCGLYQELSAKHCIVSHKEIELEHAFDERASRVIEPELVDFISHPYEWSFSQLKDAALATLNIQKAAIAKGMTLKDASSYNIQFHRGYPVLIDTLSFEIYKEGSPWIAYRQFCQHYLAPLVLIAYRDMRLICLLKEYVDGVPLDLTSRLLPKRSYLSFAVLSHIHLHAASQKKYQQKATITKNTMSKQAMLGLIDNLESFISRLKWKAGSTEWGEYYDSTNYSESSMNHKKGLVREFLESASPARVWDLGANSGMFSRIATDLGAYTVSFDIDYRAIEENYLMVKSKKETNLLPLHLDLTNPSPSIGWSNSERMSVLKRADCDTVMALALIHHLAIANNVPLAMIASLFASMGNALIIEFVPKADSQVMRLLASRSDIFGDYDMDHFEGHFKKHYDIVRKEPIAQSERTLYLMKLKTG